MKYTTLLLTAVLVSLPLHANSNGVIGGPLVDSLENIDISGSPDGVVLLPSTVHKKITDVFERYTKILADDVIVVPWRLGELELRVARLLERKAPPQEARLITAGDLVIDPERYDVYVAGKPVVLTFKEYELLKQLASNPGRVYSREALLEQVWGYHYFGGTRTVDVHVRRLRSKIEDATHTFIDTVWNVGYRFKTPS